MMFLDPKQQQWLNFIPCNNALYFATVRYRGFKQDLGAWLKAVFEAHDPQCVQEIPKLVEEARAAGEDKVSGAVLRDELSAFFSCDAITIYPAPSVFCPLSVISTD